MLCLRHCSEDRVWERIGVMLYLNDEVCGLEEQRVIGLHLQSILHD